MTKQELVDSIAKKAELSKKDAGEALDAFIETVKAALKKGDKLALTGFGTFSVSTRKARKGRNPRTNETITIKAAKVPKFTAGKGLKDAVAGTKKAK
jgi:DNA-binding protein HU-beta